MDIRRHVMLSLAIQRTCKFKRPSPSNVISAEFIIGKHVANVLVCVIMKHYTDFKNIEKVRNDQPLRMQKKSKITFPHLMKIPLFRFIPLFGDTKIRI